MTTATTTAPGTARPVARYRAPGAITRHVMNPVVAWATRRGISVFGARTLETTGRRSGAVRATPVNVLDLDGCTYLVAPRGTTDWVRNVRAANGACVLRSGRQRDAMDAVELADDAKPAVLRAYLARWRWETGQFFDGVTAHATDEELLAIAPRHPVFRLEPAAG